VTRKNMIPNDVNACHRQFRCAINNDTCQQKKNLLQNVPEIN